MKYVIRQYGRRVWIKEGVITLDFSSNVAIVSRVIQSTTTEKKAIRFNEVQANMVVEYMNSLENGITYLKDIANG